MLLYCVSPQGAMQVTNLEEFNPLTEIAHFATLVATYSEGFSVIFEPRGSIVAGVQEPLLQLACLDASLAIRPVQPPKCKHTLNPQPQCPGV
jgi:hypothetical protein